MAMHGHLYGLILVSCGAIFGAGCIGGGPSAVRPPTVDPDAAAAKAMEMYDTNNDGALAGAELDRVPAIKTALSEYDTDGDQRVTKEELASRLKSHYGTKLGLAQVDAVVRLDRVPLEGATVRFEPEPFLGDAVKPAEGVSDSSGMVRMAIPDDLMPAADRGLGAMQVGLYKVRITHPTKSIPAKYNEETTLGFEFDPNTLSAPKPVFDITSR